MSSNSNIEEILMIFYKKKLYAEMKSDIIKKKFETLQKRQQMKMKLNKKIRSQNKLMEAEIKKFENKMENLIKENEQLKKQIVTNSEETINAALYKDNTKDIWEAIQRRSLLAVKCYYKDNPVNIFNEHSSHSTPLHYASKLGHLHIIEFLISKGVEFDKIDSKGDTPLIWASEGGHLSVINYLLDKGAQINHQNKNKKTALLIAVENNQFNIVKLLIDKGANNVGLLHISYKNCYFEIFKFLLSKGAEIEELDSEGFTPLIRAVERNNFDIVKLLIFKGANNVGALHIAYKSGYLEIFKFLLSKGAEIEELDSEGFTPLIRAVQRNNFDIVKLLIDKGANKKGTLMHIANKNGHLEIFKFLLSKGAEIEEIDSEGNTPLMKAVEMNNFGIVKLLIDNGANKRGTLHIATKNDYFEILKFLLSKGAEIEEIDSEGNTPLMKAAEDNKLNIVKLLIDKGANKTGALHSASKSGCLEIIEYFLSIGAEINERDSEGCTPLMKAVQSHNSDTVKFLIDKGANKMIKNKCNETPLYFSNSCRSKYCPNRYSNCATCNSIIKLLS